MTNSLDIKQKLFNFCVDFSNSRLKVIQNQIEEIQISLLSETKSSAGDKHETGRAMLQLEREKAGQQLAEIQKLNTILSKIDIDKSSQTIGLGSLVYSSNSNYYIAISSGEIKIDNIGYYCISPNTPIGQLLIGKTINNQINFRTQKFTITKVL